MNVHPTYYVVPQLGLNNIVEYYYAFGYMLETMFLGGYLLYMFNKYLLKLDDQLYSENENLPVTLKSTNIQSAENCKGFSETIRQISENNKISDDFIN